ncbi:hypothetical protein FC52_GL001144 [Lactobacillus pasteurii DSM 23907 = CRBIP 24.76]|nr:hypothetical protein FC52_GL001144 [Lactobacillus pasteurii DSM 23907 = CRBIP 24.76]
MVLLAIVMTVIYWKKDTIFRLLSDKVDKSAFFIVAYFYLSIELFSLRNGNDKCKMIEMFL